MTDVVFHIAAVDDWQRSTDAYVPSDFAKDGFIHCSTRDQVLRVANARYAGRSDLVLVMIDAERAGEALRYEDLGGGSEVFPHLYAPLSRESVVALGPLRLRSDGTFDPESLESLSEQSGS